MATSRPRKIQGNKCYLSPYQSDDAERYLEWLNDVKVAPNIHEFSQYINLKIIDVYAESATAGGVFIHTVFDSATDRPIGSVGFDTIDRINRTGEIYVYIGEKDFCGKGYGKEAVQLILDFGFTILDLNMIILKVIAYNTPAIELYRKIGFKEQGRRRSAVRVAGKAYDVIHMDISAEEFGSPYLKKQLPIAEADR